MDQKLINLQLMKELKLQDWQVDNVVNLIDEGNTIPFIARYRKEMHGTLSDEVLRNLDERLTYLRTLGERKDSVIKLIDEQGKLTPELKKQIENAAAMVEVEDLYRPYKQKRRTRASIARERGLAPLAEAILSDVNCTDLPAMASAYIDEEKEVPSAEAALAGASDILAEQLADMAEERKYIRTQTTLKGRMTTKAKEDAAESVYETYYDFGSALNKLQPHQVLAIDRGEKEKVLKTTMAAPAEEMENYLSTHLIYPADEDGSRTFIKTSDERSEFLKGVASDAYKRLIAPSVENEIRSDLTEKAQDKAITVFEKNLQQLLMAAPIAGRTVLGFDPAFRTGCKLAVVDPTGKVLTTGVIYPTSGAVRVPEAKRELTRLMRLYKVQLIALGNGTASRESEQFLAETLKEYNPMARQLGLPTVSYVIVSEAGASVYSASKLGTEEFPDFDVALRSAVSIARRLQDPLAELVKIDPKAIGVGQYQHDMDQKKLSQALGGVVEDCVNKVGVDLNTASPSLLSYVSGISSALAKNIVSYREETGSFKSRKELLKVAKLGPKAFTQCAGFLRVPGSKEPLDNTAVHPESYEAARGLLTALGYDAKTDDLRKGITDIESRLKAQDKNKLAESLGIGVPTLEDIARELSRPGRDPREDLPSPILRTDVMGMEDLKIGMVLKGTVRNVIDFGCFVDIGVHQDGLVHISQLSDRFVKHPLDVVKVGDIVEVKVISLDIKKKRIGLSMKKN